MAFNLDERIQKQIKNTVLIIDENVDDQEFLISALEKTNYTFIRSDDTKKGYKLLIENKNIVSLVILDISSKDKDGLRFL